jgi:hypothetical protein
MEDEYFVSREPSILKEGKEFQELVQKEWLATPDAGHVKKERGVDEINGRKGRVDIFVDEIGDNLVSVVEIKNTDWDKIKPQNIRRNVKRQIRQLWRYISSQNDLCNKEVSPGIIFQKLPQDAEKLKLIESMFNNEWIQVVWHDESIERVKERMGKKSQPK